MATANMNEVVPPSSVSVRTVRLARGRDGFGLTLSGQSPCLLSSVVEGSPAALASLRVGSRVVSVGDRDVTAATHEQVVQVRYGRHSRSSAPPL